MAGNEQYTIPRLPFLQAGYGFATMFGTLLAPGGRVAAYLRSTGPQDFDDTSIAQNLVTTLSSACQRVRAGLGDTIYVLPGHSESVTDATMLTNLVAGTRIIGVGRGSNMPVFRWTATGSQWAVSKNDVIMSGLRLRLEGANGVVKGILWTGADGVLANCDIEVASGAALKATIAIEVGAGANRFELVGNVLRGTNTHNVTDGVKVVAAVDQVRIAGNEMSFSATAGNGLVHFTAAALNTKVLGNFMYNTHTASTASLVYDAVAVDGIAADNYFGILANGTASSTGVTFGVGSLIKAFQNFCSDEPQKSGILSPGPAT